MVKTGFHIRPDQVLVVCSTTILPCLRNPQQWGGGSPGPRPVSSQGTFSSHSQKVNVELAFTDAWSLVSLICCSHPHAGLALMCSRMTRLCAESEVGRETFPFGVSVCSELP